MHVITAGNSYRVKFLSFLVAFVFTGATLSATANATESSANSTTKAKPKNIIYILTDDQRFDELGFMNPVLETPNMDQLAAKGVHFKNAFVTTALCSPSRATILTGQYMHSHGVVDNNKPSKEGAIYFPSYLQQAGYETAFVGKWHMGGHHDDPQPGFDYWLSFAGQGDYYPTRKRNGKMSSFNINGQHVKQKGYITDELTDYTLNWLEKERDASKPFFVYLSHKAVHANFDPAERHREQYTDAEIQVPSSQADTPENYHGKPMWVKNQRNSWHGVDFPYHSELNVQEYKRQYHRALSAVDDSLGRITAWLKANNLDQNTAVILMGDNGFMFGEHGLIDKRNAYEESMRVPLIAYIPGAKQNYVVEEIAANLDIAPTVLDIAGIKEKPPQFAGASLLPLAQGNKVADWRDTLFYDYYWEFNFPSTPTTFALRSDDFKLIQYHGIWDTDELYDMKNDPKEMHNLIDDPRYLDVKVALRQALFERLADGGEHSVPYTKKWSSGAVLRQTDRSKAAEFPDEWLRKGNEKDLEKFFTPDDKGLKAGNN
jgi:arylsulfatase A-like enzyme